MRIEKIYIEKAGPLQDFEVEPKRFNLFYGPENESGKTLIVDFITDRLFSFTDPRLDRSEIEGRILAIVDGKPLELTGKENLFQSKYGLTKETISNIFCCRASDLEIDRKANLWRIAQEKLSDFANLNKIIEKAKEIGYHTPVAMDWKQPYKREREELRNSIRTIDEILQSAAYTDIKKYRRNHRRLKSLENVSSHKIYNEATSLLEQLHQKSEEMETKCDGIGDTEKTSNKLTELGGGIQNVSSRIAEIREAISKSEETISGKEKESDDLRGERERYADFAYEDLREQTRQTREIERKAQRDSIVHRNKWLPPLAALLGAEAIILGIILNPLLFWFAILLVIPIYALIEDVRKAKLQDQLRENLRTLSVKLAKYLDKEPSFKATNDAEIATNKIQQYGTKIRTKLTKTETRLDEAKKRLDEEKNKLTEQQKREKTLSGELNQFLEDNRCKTVEELKQKIDLKNTLLKKMKPLRERVIRLLEEEDDTKWTSILQQLKKKIDVEKARKHPKLEMKLDELEREIEKLREEQEELAQSVEEHKKKIYGQGVKSLYELVEKIDESKHELQQLEEQFLAGSTVVQVLERMLESQKELLAAVFEEGEDSISERFKKFTKGRYIQVFLDGEAVKVRTRGGRILVSSVLSTGTLDTLHLLIRTLFAEILTGERSFLFFDDPFLKFDKISRRKEGVKTLKRLMDNGWQIFFFTLDDHFCDLIKETIPDESLLVIELPQLTV